mmetsp:Transcript_13062/g.41024  ORF Transcript_13062/g.41024 Transcript_13062/m.41024 type:complete len:207 (-) Transcript_13062:557-1177(-)
MSCPWGTAELLCEVAESAARELLLACGLGEGAERVEDTFHLLFDEDLLGLFTMRRVLRHQRVEHKAQKQHLHQHEERQPQEATPPVLRVGSEKAIHKVLGDSSDKHRVERVCEGIKALVDWHSLNFLVEVREDCHNDPREEDDGGHEEGCDGEELAHDRPNAPQEAPHPGQQAEVARTRHKRQPHAGPVVEEHEHVHELEGQHCQS